MRSRIRRHLGLLFSAPSIASDNAKSLIEVADDGQPKIPAEFTPRQFAVFLLHIAASIEHALMVEYLYAGFSLGGPDLPMEFRVEVAQWQETILGIAKEEMGHLMTVQNLLRCLGGPLNLDREDYPWDSELYPFPFKLEPLTRQSLAKYVYVESPGPDIFTGKEADIITSLANESAGGAALHRVGLLYSILQSLLKDPEVVSDEEFRASTFPYQANWDEWGRGYQAGARGNSMGGSVRGTPDVLILPVTSRSDALAALKAIATQGEANPNPTADGAPSHFARFLNIFGQFQEAMPGSPSRKIPVNPVVDVEAEGTTPITNREAVLWAHLFNLRYRMLLTNLLHTFEYPSNLVESSQKSPRGLLVDSTFGEMYNLRALAHILVETPLATDRPGMMAGPPFQMPYTLRLPVEAVDRWRLHMDLLIASGEIADQLLKQYPASHRKYLLSLQDTDRRGVASIQKILTEQFHFQSARRTACLS